MVRGGDSSAALPSISNQECRAGSAREDIIHLGNPGGACVVLRWDHNREPALRLGALYQVHIPDHALRLLIGRGEEAFTGVLCLASGLK